MRRNGHKKTGKVKRKGKERALAVRRSGTARARGGRSGAIRKSRKTVRSAGKRFRPAVNAVLPAAPEPVRDYEQGFEDGYRKGLQEAPPARDEAAIAKAFQDGVYTGGDGLIDTLLPGDMILPEVPAIEVMAAGLEQMRPRFHRLLHSAEVSTVIREALDTGSPLSVVRLGDGELLTLAQEAVMSPEIVRKEGPFLSYAGVHVPDLEARDQLLHAVRQASLIGIPKLRVPHFQPLAFSVFRAYGIDYRTLRLTDSLINYQLYKDGFLSGILAGRRVLAVGNLAEPFAGFLSGHGVAVAGHVSPVNGVKDVPRAMERIRGQAGNFDIALISAGISAVLLAQQVASELGKVALDFGHLADSMLKGEAPYHM